MKSLCVVLACLSLGGDQPPTAPAEPPSAGAGPRFGVNDNSVATNLAAPDTVMRRLAEIGGPGGGVYRFTVDWRNIEPHDDQWVWEPYDRVYRAALEHGLEPLPILLNAPRWARGVSGACVKSGGRCISPPGRAPHLQAEWREFAAAVAARWPESVAIEVWNEPNIRAFWTTLRGPSPAHYNELLCGAYDAIKRVDRGMTVLLGGLANPRTSLSVGHISQRDFLRAMYALGGARRCNDAIALHPYPLQARPDGDDSRFATDMRRARAEIARNDDAGRPLWITEFGYFTGVPLPWEVHPARRPVTEEEQARWLTCAYRLAAGMPDVRAFLVHTLFDPGLNAAYGEHNFGLNRHPQMPGVARKPAHDALVELFRRHPDGVPPATDCD